MKLLLVEDEETLANSIRKYLEEKQFICEWVQDVSGALGKIALYEYDCILLDLMLPDGRRFEVLHKIRRIRKTDGVIILSAIENLETKN